MNSSFFSLLSTVSKYSVVLPFVVGLLKWKELSRVQVRILVLTVCYLITELLADKEVSSWLWVFLWGKETNLPILHVFTVLQFGLLVWIYRDFLLIYLNSTKINLLIGGFAVFGVINAIWIDGFFYLNPYARALESLILLTLIFSYFIHLLRYMEVERLEKEPLFWISAGMTIYFSGSFLIFLFSNYLLQTTEFLLSIYGIHSILNALTNVFIAIALWVTPPRI